MYVSMYTCVQGPKGNLGLPGLPGAPGFRGQNGDRVRQENNS